MREEDTVCVGSDGLRYCKVCGEEKEHRELVSRNTSICFDESRMEECTFENVAIPTALVP